MTITFDALVFTIDRQLSVQSPTPHSLQAPTSFSTGLKPPLVHGPAPDCTGLKLVHLRNPPPTSTDIWRLANEAHTMQPTVKLSSSFLNNPLFYFKTVLILIFHSYKKLH